MDKDTLMVMQNGLARVLGLAKNLAELQMHLMDWILKNVGYCNIALWLADEDDEMLLSAYMKYTLGAEDIDLSTFQQELWNYAKHSNTIVNRLATSVTFPWTVKSCGKFEDMEVIAVNVMYLAESLGMIAVFREQSFSAHHVEVAEIVEALFPPALASLVNTGDEYDEAEPDENQSERKPAKQDPADWWKRGEEPPF
jgi:hypothetical protein